MSIAKGGLHTWYHISYKENKQSKVTRCSRAGKFLENANVSTKTFSHVAKSEVSDEKAKHLYSYAEITNQLWNFNRENCLIYIAEA